jgi:hypothetical protein
MWRRQRWQGTPRAAPTTGAAADMVAAGERRGSGEAERGDGDGGGGGKAGGSKGG